MARRDRRPRVFWTSADVARALGVGVSSIKRWTDEGELRSIRTVGGHRRYELGALWQFARARNLTTEGLPPLDDVAIDPSALIAPSAEELCGTLVAALRDGDSVVIRRALARHAVWDGGPASFFDRIVGRALELIGDDWAAGDATVDEEHRASAALVEWLERLRPESEPSPQLALLSCPPGELHEIPLRMARVILEWNGWSTDYLGASLPWDAFVNAIESHRPRLVLSSARSAEAFEGQGFAKIAALCHRRNTLLGIGGHWARGGVRRSDSILRFRSIRGFERWLRSYHQPETPTVRF